MGKIKKYHFNFSITTIIVESVGLPLALFLLFAQLWGLIMQKGSLPETFWEVIPMDIKAAWELYAVAFSILGFWAWLRIHLYRKNQKKEEAKQYEKETERKVQVKRDAKIIKTQEAILKIAKAILGKLDKDKSDGTPKQ